MNNIFTENYNHISHSHCWNQKQPSACGIELCTHTQCCLCDLLVPEKSDEDTKGGTCSKCGQWKGGAYGVNGAGVQSRHVCALPETEKSGWEERERKLLRDIEKHVVINYELKQALTTYKEELRGKIGGLRTVHDECDCEYGPGEHIGRNNAIRDILSALELE